MNPRYPVFVISKGRHKSCLTARELTNMGVPFTLIVEPQELEKYAQSWPESQITVTPFSNLGNGSVPARNFVWELAASQNAERHWI